MALAPGDITRADLRTVVVDLIKRGETLAGGNVFDQRFWTLKPSQYPAVLVSTPIEAKENLSPSHAGAPTFDTDVTIAISARTVSGATPGSLDKVQAEVDLDCLMIEIERLLLSTPYLLQATQGIKSIHTQFQIDPNGAEIVGQGSILVVATIRQQYWPELALPLKEIHATITNADTGVTMASFDADPEQV